MQPFILHHAKDLSEASGALHNNIGAKSIGGGTNLLDLMKMYVETPSELIDLSDLPLRSIKELSNGGVSVGALVSNSELAYHPLIVQKYPVLSQAILSGASAQLRNMATTGGNILQRTRCPYFFNTSFPCNKRMPGSGCPAIKGFNRSHAILGTSDHCIATHPSDMCVALAALDAKILLKGNNGERSVMFTDFHLLPGSNPEKESVIQHDEIITGIELPNIPYATSSNYLKVRDRASYEFALTSSAVAMDIANGRIKEARIALGGVGTKPWRSKEAEQILAGAENNIHSYNKAADAALASAHTFKYNAFKIELAKRTLIRSLKITGGLS